MEAKDFFRTYNMVSPPEDMITEEETIKPEYNPLQRIRTYIQNKKPLDDELTENVSLEKPLNYPKDNLDISFTELVKQEKLPLLITSSYRKNSKTKNGNISNHSKTDDKGNSLAYDVLPFFGGRIDKSDAGFNKLRNALYNNERVMRWFKYHGFGVLEEISPEIMRKTGATGKHFHIGVDNVAKKMTTEKTGLQYAQNGAKLGFVKYSPFELLEKLYADEIYENIPDFNYIVQLLPEEDIVEMDEILEEVLGNEEKNEKTYTKDYTIHKTVSFNTKRDFIKTMAPIIKKELDKIGKTPHLYNVLAQMALESGWGKHLSGKNNFAGLKATSSEKGTMRKTKEYEGKQVISKFKDFDSVEDFAKYYVNRLNTKFHAFDSGDYTANIKLRGYFTANENLYRLNLNSIKQSILNLV